MFADDTIAAISTPLGEGGIGIVRLSGKNALPIAEKLFHSPKNKSLRNAKSHSVIYGFIKDPAAEIVIDEILAMVMRSPYSYTREDVVEIHCHGGMIPLRKTLELVLKHGARLADPGEFTKRAFMNGRIDLSQAEAVLDLVKSKTDESRRIAMEQLQGGLSEKITTLRDRLTRLCVNIEAYIDFPEDEIETASKRTMLQSMKDIGSDLELLLKTYDEARFFREGLSTAIVGRPNVGKSSLLNALIKKDRAIVTELPGTTRDIIEEYLNIKGLPLRIMDTAGIRDVQDAAEKEGVKRSLRSIEHADLVIAIFDRNEPIKDEDVEVLNKIKNKNAIIVLNKCDLPFVVDEDILVSLVTPHNAPVLHISATRGDGLEELKDSIVDSCLKDWKEERDGIVISNLRHKIALEHATISLERARVGSVTTEDILNMIFNEFCIGK
jgi:tRNA modification GTPase